MPKPYYSDDQVTLYLGDCLDNSIIDIWLDADVLVTDPPYGVAYVSNSSKYGSTKPIAGDETIDLRDEVLAAWHVTHGDEGPALVFGRWDIPRPVDTRNRLIWDKGDSPGMGDLSMPWGKGEEEIYVIGQGFIGGRQTNVIRAKGYASMSHARPNHPTPKPVALMEALIEKCPAGVIADPFAGSGATLVAARNLGRKAIGVELDEKYCEVIARRLMQSAFVFEEEEEVHAAGWME